MSTTINRAKARERLAELGMHAPLMPADIDLEDGTGFLLNPSPAEHLMARRNLAMMNALSPDTGGSGAFTMPEPKTAGTIVEENLGEASVMRRICNVIPGDAINQAFAFINDNETEGRQLGAGQNQTETDPTFEGRSSYGHKYSSDKVAAPFELVRDVLALVPALLSVLARRVARRQNRAFTAGTGANEPMGLLNGCAVGVTTASSVSVLIDELFDLMGSLDSEYTSNGQAALMMHPLILAMFQKTKDGAGQNMWKASGLSEYPIHLNSHMPSAIVAGSPLVLYGDYKRAYTIREMETRFITLHEMYRENDQEGFELIQIVDGFIQDGHAVKSLVVHS